MADLAFAAPLYVAPTWTLGLLGWQHVDPIATRIAAAALFGIGIESLLCRNAGLETFKAMLNLKVIWSTASVVGLVWAMTLAEDAPPLAWVALAGFAPFSAVWHYYRWRLHTEETTQRGAAVS